MPFEVAVESLEYRSLPSKEMSNSTQAVPLERRDFGLAVLGEEIVESLGQQVLDRGLALGRQQPELLFHGRREVAGDIGFPDPAGPACLQLALEVPRPRCHSEPRYGRLATSPAANRSHA